MAVVATYAFKDVVILLDGNPLTGFDAGDGVVELERTADQFSDIIGADGDAVIVGSSDTSGTVMLKLLMGAASHGQLDAKLRLQAAGAFSPFGFSIRDRSLNELALAEAAYVTGPPKLGYGASASSRIWKVRLPAVDIFALGAS